MKHSILIITLINMLCKPTTHQSPLHEKIYNIFNSKSEFEKNESIFDSLIYSSLFKLNCEFLSKLNLKYYQEKRSKVDQIINESPVITHGGQVISGTSFRSFDLLKASCPYFGLNCNHRFNRIIDALEDSLKINNLGTNERHLLWITMDSISIDTLVNVINSKKSNTKVFHQLYLNLLKKHRNDKDIISKLEFLLLHSREAIESYELQILLLSSSRIAPELRKSMLPII